MEAVIEWVTQWGYAGLFVAALVAGSILPFSSEAIIVAVAAMGLDPVICVAVAAAGNTLGGMTCYWVGTKGKTEWIERLGVRPQRLESARRFVAHRGAWMAFFAFLPTIGTAIAVLLGLMRSNLRITVFAMLLGKTLRYAALMAVFYRLF